MDVAERVGGNVQVILNSKAPAGLEPPFNAAAHEEYLRGRYQWNKRNKPGLAKAIRHFQRAIEIDPMYVNAYAGLADSYLLMANYSINTKALGSIRYRGKPYSIFLRINRWF
jgi:tetratricopeptide (TPR) repeat protein